MEKKYIAFISYRHAPRDSAVAQALHSLIERYIIPKKLRKTGKKLGIVFRDKEELPVSNDLSEDIRRALDASEYLIVVCSKDTAGSQWVQREIDYFHAHHGYEKVFTILADGEPSEVLPQSLLQEPDPETGEMVSVEPLAVDVRADSPGAMRRRLRREIVRLYAAMLGCPYDALVLREQRRKRQRFAAAMSVILAVVLSFTAMVLVKNREIDRKNQELEEKNRELEQQKAEVQLRESELLTQEAQEALAADDRFTAIENAAAALPGPEEDRPYYAPAEQALYCAIMPFENPAENYLMYDTVLEQNTPVADFCVSGDGKLLTTVDPYSVLTCFDTVTGQQLWTRQMITDSVYNNMRIYACPLQNSVLFYGGTLITALSQQTGEVLWSVEDIHLDSNYLFLSRDQSTLALMYRKSNDDFTERSFYLVFLSAQDGSLRQAIHLIDGKEVLAEESDFPEVSLQVVYSNYYEPGAFSSDGNRFAGSYLTQQADGTCELHYFIADMESGTCQTVYRQSAAGRYTTTVYRMAFTDDDTSLLVMRSGENNSVAAELDKVSVQDQTLLWHYAAPPVPNKNYRAGIILWNPGERRILIAGDNVMYSVDAKTGEQITIISLYDSVATLAPLPDGTFGFVLQNGYYAVGWHTSSNSLIDSQWFNGGVFQLGSSIRAELWNGGSLRLTEDDNDNTGFYAADEDAGAGFAVVIPEKNEHSVVIKRAKKLETGFVRNALDILKPDDGIYESGTQFVDENTLAIGPIVGTVNETSTYRYELIDPATLASKGSIELMDLLFSEEVQILPGGSGYILCDERDDITLYDARTGETTALWSWFEKTEFQTDGETVLTYGNLGSSTRLSDGYDLLSVVCTELGIKLWRNGVHMQDIAYPEEMIWPERYDAEFYTQAGGNGFVVVGALGGSGTDSFFAYDTSEGEWYRIPAELEEYSFPKSCVGLTTAVFLVLDVSGTVHVYDIRSQTKITEFSTGLPGNSVEEMALCMEDRFLVILTESGEIRIFDTHSGELVYTEQTDMSSGYGIVCYEDPDSGCLFITNRSITSSSFCLKTDDWMKLAEIPYMLLYDQQTRMVYQYDSSINNIAACYMPTTEELTALGRKLLEER